MSAGMPPQGGPGWFADPSGRFGSRWYDGSNWSEHVVGADGAAALDPLPSTPTAQPAPGPAPYGPSGQRARYRPGPGLIVAAIGVIVVAVSLFGPHWINSGDSSFLKLGSNARDATLPDDADADVVIAYTYLAWAGFVLFGLTIVFTIAGLVPIPPTSHSAMRIAGAVVAGVAAVMHAATFGQIATEDRTAFAYLGMAGFYVVIVGLTIGVRRVQT